MKLKLTVAKKIGLLILIALTGVVVLTGLMWRNVDDVFEATNFANVNTVPSMRELDTAYDAIADMREALALLVSQTDERGWTPLEQRITASQKRAEDALALYEKEDMDEPQTLFVPDKANLDASRALLAQYVALKSKVVALARAGRHDEARDLLMAAQDLPTRMAASFAAHRKLNIDFAANASVEAAATRIGALTRFGSVAVLMLLAVGGVGFFAARSIVVPLKQAAEVADRVAAGDLSWQIAKTSRDETGQVLAALQRMQASLSATVNAVRESAHGVATAGTGLAQGHADLSQRTGQQAAAIEQTSASMEELLATVKNNAESAHQASALAQNANQVALAGGQVVERVVGTMKGINGSAQRIADIISVIDGIAFQTNILALNAAVEAARAGEQGRGFAVVASEVRHLAQRSATAAKEIKGLITDSVDRVNEGNALADQAGRTMQEVVAAIREVSAIVQAISNASVEQSAGISQVGSAVGEIDRATQQNAALVERAGAATESLQSQARTLVDSVAVFRLRGEEALAAADSSTRP